MEKRNEQQLQLEYVEKRYGAIQVLDRIQLTINKGEFVSIIGPSGCGKSTLLEIIAGLTMPDGGKVRLDGHDITGQKGFVAYMPQRDALFPWRTVIDNVIVPLQLMGIHKKDAYMEAERLLPMFGLESFAHHYPSQLSGGMRQRAAFLRTYLCKKEWLLLDEPFGSLDALTRYDLQRWLLSVWSKWNQSVLFVTHDIDEAIFLSDRIYVMSPRPGRIVQTIDIKLPRPRTPEQLTTAEFISTKSDILTTLEKSR